MQEMNHQAMGYDRASTMFSRTEGYYRLSTRGAL